MSEKQPITADRLRHLFDYDPATGAFTRRVQTHHRWKVGQVAGTKHRDGYIQINIDGRIYKSHRLAWLWVHGEWPNGEVDHINGDNSVNRIDNLRVVTGAENKQNQRRGHRGSTSPLLGVSYSTRRQRWVACIAVHRKFKFLGYHESELLAHEAYVRAKRDLHPAGML